MDQTTRQRSGSTASSSSSSRKLVKPRKSDNKSSIPIIKPTVSPAVEHHEQASRHTPRRSASVAPTWPLRDTNAAASSIGLFPKSALQRAATTAPPLQQSAPMHHPPLRRKRSTIGMNVVKNEKPPLVSHQHEARRATSPQGRHNAFQQLRLARGLAITPVNEQPAVVTSPILRSPTYRHHPSLRQPSPHDTRQLSTPFSYATSTTPSTRYTASPAISQVSSRTSVSSHSPQSIGNAFSPHGLEGSDYRRGPPLPSSPKAFKQRTQLPQSPPLSIGMRGQKPVSVAAAATSHPLQGEGEQDRSGRKPDAVSHLTPATERSQSRSRGRRSSQIPSVDETQQQKRSGSASMLERIIGKRRDKSTAPKQTKSQQVLRKGPVTGTGHEGYGKFGFRGRNFSFSSLSRAGRSKSADSLASTASSDTSSAGVSHHDGDGEFETPARPDSAHHRGGQGSTSAHRASAASTHVITIRHTTSQWCNTARHDSMQPLSPTSIASGFSDQTYESSRNAEIARVNPSKQREPLQSSFSSRKRDIDKNPSRWNFFRRTQESRRFSKDETTDIGLGYYAPDEVLESRLQSSGFGRTNPAARAAEEAVWFAPVSYDTHRHSSMLPPPPTVPAVTTVESAIPTKGPERERNFSRPSLSVGSPQPPGPQQLDTVRSGHDDHGVKPGASLRSDTTKSSGTSQINSTTNQNSQSPKRAIPPSTPPALVSPINTPDLQRTDFSPISSAATARHVSPQSTTSDSDPSTAEKSTSTIRTRSQHDRDPFVSSPITVPTVSTVTTNFLNLPRQNSGLSLTTSDSNRTSSFAPSMTNGVGAGADTWLGNEQMWNEEIWTEYNDLIDHISASNTPVASGSRTELATLYRVDGLVEQVEDSRSNTRPESNSLPALRGSGSTLKESPAMTLISNSGQLGRCSAASSYPAVTPTTPYSLSDIIGNRQSGYTTSIYSQTSEWSRPPSRPASRIEAVERVSPIQEEDEHSRQSSATINSNSSNSRISDIELRYTALMTSKWLALSTGRGLWSRSHVETKDRLDTKVLVVDGLGLDWSHYCAETYPTTTFYNLDVSSSNLDRGLPNHHTVKHDSLGSSFPFPKDYFAGIIFRFPVATFDAAYNNCILDCKRVLRPGGFLEVSVLDIDMVNMGGKCRSALRSLKTKMHLRNRTTSLHNVGDMMMSLIGQWGFENVQRGVVGIPVAGVLTRSGGILSGFGNEAGPPKGKHAASQAPVSGQQVHTPTFAEIIQASQDAPPSGAGVYYEAIATKIAMVGRWWYSTCYPSEEQEEKRSMWEEPGLLRECEERGTTFKLLLCHAQKPGPPPPRRTASL